MPAILLPPGKQMYFNNAGAPLAGGRIYTYDAGTNTPRQTWQDPAQTIVNANPVVLDARGEALVFWSGNYKVVLKDASDVTIWSVDNVQDQTAASNAYTDTLRSDVSGTGNAAKGAGFVPFDPTLAYQRGSTGAALQDGYVNVMNLVTTQAERTAIKNYTSTTDHTALINAALANGKRVYLPAGRWNVDPAVGVKLPIGGSIVGDGIMRTIIRAAANGGIVGDLASYSKGSVIKRAFTPGVANAYVTGCYLADFSVQLTHAPFVIGGYRQVGIDLRNITRSVVERVHSGNSGVPGQPICPVPSRADSCQGYGFVCGTRSSSLVDYCGGEVNTIRDCLAWGAYRPIVVDDDEICLLSGAHATVIENCDIQGGHSLLTQRLPYSAGVIFQNNTVQNNIRQPGALSSDPTQGTAMGGYNSKVVTKYGEMGNECDQIHVFLNGAHNCHFESIYNAYSGASVGAYLDNGAPGSRNYLKYAAPVFGNPTGETVEYYNKAPTKGMYVGNYNVGPGTFTVEKSQNVNFTRNGLGDYFMNVTPPQSNKFWMPNILIETNASFNAGSVVLQYSTQTADRVRVYFYSQVGGVTTAVDPTKIYASFTQTP